MPGSISTAIDQPGAVPRLPAEALGSDAVEDDDLLVGDAPAARRFVVDRTRAGERLDKALAMLMPEVSRSRLQQWIESGVVRVGGGAARVRQTLVEGDRIDVEPPEAPASAPQAEPIPLDLVHADKSLFVIDKPPGLVVHPGAGHPRGTLLNGLLALDPALAGLPRAGIVHRLDAETSGLMVVARSLPAQLDLVRQLQARSVVREYWAIVHGAAPVAGTIERAIGRDPRNPVRFRVAAVGGREARTRFRRVAVVPAGPLKLSWLACRLDTGRTHQIRVHLESIGHPLVGDPVYRRGQPARAAAAGAGEAWAAFARQALHACRLELQHPGSGRSRAWHRAPPPDLQALMRGLGFAADDASRSAFADGD